MYVIDQNNEGKMYYIYTDHASTTLSTGLGSPNLITDAQCNVVQELSYDACFVKLGFWEYSEPKTLIEPIPTLREGNRRDPATWRPFTSTPTEPFIDRGFTFHSLPREERNGEHLYPFTLINMLSEVKSRSEALAGNGRAGVYPERCNRFGNPLVGRFLSADPYIQAPDNTQNLNRYSYCLNNPLKYSDPQGEFLIEAMIIGGLANWLMSGGKFNSEGLLSFTVGAFSGFAGAGIGASAANAVTIGGFAGGFQVGAAGGAAGGFTGGAGYAWTHGASLGEGLLAGLTGAGIGAALGGLAGGISKGIADHKLGLDFWDRDGTLELRLSKYKFSKEEIRIAKENAKNYNRPGNPAAIRNDGRLSDYLDIDFNAGVGTHGIKMATTTTIGTTYGIDPTSGCFVSEEGGVALGFYNPNHRSLHISLAVLDNHVDFKEVAGHELGHAYHHNMLGIFTNWTYSERACYDYSYNNRISSEYGDVIISAFVYGGWQNYPKQYFLPFYYYR